MLQIKLARRVLQEYVCAYSMDEAVGYLGAHQGEARVVAGGSDLLPRMQRGEVSAPYLVDISQVLGLRKISIADGVVTLGGATPLTALAENPELGARCHLIPHAARLIATPQVRRLATVGGNVACGWGNSEVALSLLALDAEAEVYGYMGPQWVPVRSLYAGGGVSRIDATREVLDALRFHPLDPGQGGALARLNGQPGPVRSPLVGVLIVALEAAKDQSEWPVVQWAAVALGVAERTPSRLGELEAALAGAPLPVARSLLIDGLNDALLELGAEHPARRRLDDALAMMADCWDRAVRLAWTSKPN